MDADPSLLSFNVALGVLLVDILLSGDNAIVIALVCRRLSPAHRSKALWLGVLGAFGARLLLTSVATLAMNLPLIKLIGGLLLLKIAIDLMVDNAGQSDAVDASDSAPDDVFAAARTIVLADIVMSLDNVVALSAITQNNVSMLVAGLLLSIPILMFGSLYIARLLAVFPYLIWVGGAILGGVSGALMVDDPIFDGAFNNASSMAGLVVPLLAAVLVVQLSRVMLGNASAMRGLQKPRSFFDIVWSRQAPHGADLLPVAVAAAVAPAAHAVPVVAQTVLAAPVAASAAAPVAAIRVPPSAGAGQSFGDHRVVMALGLFMVLAGGLAYYMINAYEPPAPQGSFTYFCKAQGMSISFRPHAGQIRFATTKGVVSTTVIEDRIVWEDYREAGARLAVAPPVKVVSVDAAQLVVNGGMFDNAACAVAAQR